MRFKRFLVVFFIASFILLSMNCYINFKYDLYGIFDKNFNISRYPYVNEHYSKMDYLVNNRVESFDSIIFGSSRCKGINPSLFLEKAYNLAYPAGIPSDYLDDIKILLDNRIIPRKIYIGLDDFSYKREPSEVHSVINFNGYKSRLENLKYKIALLTKKPSTATYKYMLNRLYEDKCLYNIEKDGSIVEENRRIIYDWRQYVYEKRFKNPTIFSEKNKRTHIVIDEIKLIKKMCDENGIELVLFITPTHITTYLYDDIDNFNEFKRALTNIAPVYDFSTINNVTVNNYYWKETSHARKIVLDMIANRLCNNMEMEYPKNFCVIANGNNIDEHIKNLKNERIMYIKETHPQYIPSNNKEEYL